MAFRREWWSLSSRLTGSTHAVDSVTQARWLMSADDAPSLTSKRPASATRGAAHIVVGGEGAHAQRQAHRLRLPGLQRDLGEGLQLLRRSHQRAGFVVYVELHHLTAGARAGVAHRQRDGQLLAGLQRISVKCRPSCTKVLYDSP